MHAVSTQKYKGEDIVQCAMGGFNQDGKYVYGSLVLTPRAMVYYDKKGEDVCPLVNAAKVELVKGGPIFAVTLKDGGEKQYRTGNAKAWVAKIDEWIKRVAQAPAGSADSPGAPVPFQAPVGPADTPAAPVPFQAPVGPADTPTAPVHFQALAGPTDSPAAPAPFQAPALQPPVLRQPASQQNVLQPPHPVPVATGTMVASSYQPAATQSVYPPHPPQAQPPLSNPLQIPPSQPIVEVILAGLEPRSPAGNEFRLPVFEWSQVWAVVSAMIVMAPENESISKDVAIQVLLPSTGFQVAGLDHRVAAQIIDTALTQQQQKTIDIVAVTYGKIDFGVMYDDLKGVPSPPFDAERFLMNCSQYLEFAKDNLGFTVTIAKPALAIKPAPSVAPTTAAAPARRDFQFCTSCGRQNAITARFCVRCGKPVKPTI